MVWKHRLCQFVEQIAFPGSAPDLVYTGPEITALELASAGGLQSSDRGPAQQNFTSCCIEFLQV